MMAGEAWYVLYSKPHKEQQLNTYLQAQGIVTFFPTIRVKPVNPRAARIRPYFPRYLFVYANLDEVGLSFFRWATGTACLVEFDGQPAVVPEYVIHQLKQHLETIEAAGGFTLDEFQKGTPVRIIHGPLAGYEAIFDLRLTGTERVQVMLDMLGRSVRVKIDANAIEKKR